METREGHLDDDRIKSLRGRTLAPAELIETSRHLRECAACRARVESDAALIPAARLLDRELSAENLVRPHLEFETLLQYVEETMSAEERENATAHLEECATCRAEADDLQKFRREVAERKERRPRTRYVAVAAAIAAAFAAAFFLTRPSPAPPRTAPPRSASVAPILVVALRDGARHVGIDASGRLHGTTVDGEWANVVANALRNPDLEEPRFLRTLTGTSDVQRGTLETRELVLREPVGVVVESDRPNFRWSSTLDGARYELAVFDDAGHIVVRGSTSEPAWQPEKPLRRAASYLWQVRAVAGAREVIAPAPDQPEARFAILRTDVATEIAAARDRNAGHLVLGVLYFNGGAIAEARREFEALAAENPRSDVAKRLLASSAG